MLLRALAELVTFEARIRALEFGAAGDAQVALEKLDAALREDIRRLSGTPERAARLPGLPAISRSK